MSVPLEPGYVLPKPRTTQVFGMLNILYGILMLGLTYFSVLMYVFAPVGEALLQEFMGTMGGVVKGQKDNNIRKLERLVELAPNEVRRAHYQNRLDSARAEPVIDFTNMPMGMDVLREPAFRTYGAADFLTGLPLAVAIMIAGGGLLRLREWARKLALWASIAKVVALVGLLVYALAVVYPVQTRIVMKQMEAQQKMMAGTPAAAANPFGSPQMMALMSVSTSASGIFWFAVLGAYPAVVIWIMSKPGVRAACWVASRPKVTSEGGVS